MKVKWSTLGFLFFFLTLSSPLKAAVTVPDQLEELPPAALTIPGDVPVAIDAHTLNSGGIRILVFSDAGNGDALQMQLAGTMADFCSRNGCHFGLMLGDNIYPAGVRSTDDPQFIEKFEKPYARLAMPILGILGEHDWGRKGVMYNWRAQIDYSKKSRLWLMPSDVYAVTMEGLKILALNTNSLPISKYQKKWLAEELDRSKFRWNVVIGHKPILSYGYHGDTDFMVSETLPLLCGRADLYLAGHEHNSQILKADCGLHLVITGATNKLRPEKPAGPRSLFTKNEPGFAYLVVEEKKLTVRMVSSSGEIWYTLVIPKN
jgi:tartrate-resistant acid phosphatase type 5